MTLENFSKNIQESIEKEWNKNVYKVLKDIYSDTAINLSQKMNEVNTIFGTSEFYNDYIEAIKQKNFNLFKGKMGLIFEQFLNDKILSPVFESAAVFANRHLTSLVSGAFKSVSSVTNGSRNIRPDLLVQSVGLEFKNQDGVLVSNTNNLPIELHRKLSINWDKIPSFDNEADVDADTLNKFLTNSDFFGFSAKVYNMEEDNKRFSESSVIQSAINSVFWQPNGQKYSQKRHSWERDYANIYVVWNLSRIIRTIISPTTIAMFYGNGMMWMNDFLSSRLFYMKVANPTKIGKHSAGKDSAGEDRIFPSLNSPAIATKNFDMTKRLLNFTTKKVNKKVPHKNITYKGIEFVLT